MFRTICLSGVAVLISFSSGFEAKAKGDREALYMVPGAPEWIEYSRFIVPIVKPYDGSQSREIAYVFPEALIGEARKVVTFKRDDENANFWKGEGLNAFCVETGEIFSCNVSLDKSTGAPFSREKSLAHLKTMNLTADQHRGLAEVIDGFFDEEPAGFLSYEF